jgi:hypothetical protein
MKIKHLQPREFPKNLMSLFHIHSMKMKFVRKQKWDKAGKWREKEIKYVQKHFNINIQQNQYYGQRYLDKILTNS